MPESTLLLLVFGLDRNDGLAGGDDILFPRPPSLVAVLGILVPPNGLAAAGVCCCVGCWNGFGLPLALLDVKPLFLFVPNGEEDCPLVVLLFEDDDPPLPNGLLLPGPIGGFGCKNGLGPGPLFPPSLSPFSPLLLGGNPKGEGEDGILVLPLPSWLWPPSGPLTKGLGPAHIAVDDNHAQERRDRQQL